jgi:hypothetical protein
MGKLEAGADVDALSIALADELAEHFGCKPQPTGDFASRAIAWFAAWR